MYSKNDSDKLEEIFEQNQYLIIEKESGIKLLIYMTNHVI